MRIVFTGSPCTGKTSTFEAFKKMTLDSGYFDYKEELARVWLEYFDKHEPYKHPRNDRDFFQGFIETLHKKNWLEAKEDKIVDTIYDRGLPDEIAYRTFFDYEDQTGELYIDCQDKYVYDMVFFFPFWEEIYKNDTVRAESLEEALKIQENIIEAYDGCGYDMIIVPFGTIEERCQFILDNINENIKVV